MDFITMLKKQHKILVITGPPASGKSLMAKQLAEKHGTQGWVEPYDMKINHRFKKYLNGADVIIVDGITRDEWKHIPAKTILNSATGEYVLIEEKGTNIVRQVKMPFLIFVTQRKEDAIRYVTCNPHENALKRRLHIIELGNRI